MYSTLSGTASARILIVVLLEQIQQYMNFGMCYCMHWIFILSSCSGAMNFLFIY